MREGKKVEHKNGSVIPNKTLLFRRVKKYQYKITVPFLCEAF